MRSSDRLVRSSFARKYRAVLWDAPRTNHTWGIRHLARPTRDVGSADRRESVVEARCKYGLGKTWQFALVRSSSVARNASHRGLGGIVDERSCRECAPPPSEATPKWSPHLPPVWATLGQLDHFVALAFQQNGQQSALRKSQV
jgi:hypothetical protein